jgi:hypothetical protein
MGTVSGGGRSAIEGVSAATLAFGKRGQGQDHRQPFGRVPPDTRGHRDRTPEEVERLRLAAESKQADRYRVVYETLGIQVTANKDK